MPYVGFRNLNLCQSSLFLKINYFVIYVLLFMKGNEIFHLHSKEAFYHLFIFETYIKALFLS